ncbi:TPA: 3-dehydroquinate synthase, partial [Candidatus Sumerlaeota bacterium]|nr:3-dehydroquinate synthase [Candidatus Sumerlaeota bacterium]
MKEITVGLGDRSYPILINETLTAEMANRIHQALPGCDRLVLITNATVGGHYAASTIALLESAGLRVDTVEIPDGETAKNTRVVDTIWDFLIDHACTRQSALAALGGGVVGDITGFAAACYMRGIDFVQIPTTLLSMVDSSVGGKTGVNHPRAKNVIGAFWQPRLVCINTATLHTLPVEEFRSGFAEVIKHGVIRDSGYFGYLEDHLDAIFALDTRTLEQVVAGSCQIKSEVVSKDEREGGLRAILNFGHTVGHAVEALGDYGSIRHGEGVAVGMVAAAEISHRMNLCDARTVQRITALIERSQLPTQLPGHLTAEAVLER